MFSTALAAALLLAATLSLASANPDFAPPPRPAPPLHSPSLFARPLSDGPDTVQSADLAADEREFVNRINAERTERGLYALTPDPILVQTARSHSWDMCARGYFSHVTSAAGGHTPMDRYLSTLHAGGQATPGYLLVGENIYYCSLSRPGHDVLLGHQALMNSPGHRANILDPRFARVGVGIYRDPSGQIWVTEMFLRDSGE